MTSILTFFSFPAKIWQQVKSRAFSLTFKIMITNFTVRSQRPTTNPTLSSAPRAWWGVDSWQIYFFDLLNHRVAKRLGFLPINMTQHLKNILMQINYQQSEFSPYLGFFEKLIASGKDSMGTLAFAAFLTLLSVSSSISDIRTHNIYICAYIMHINYGNWLLLDPFFHISVDFSFGFSCFEVSYICSCLTQQKF